MDDLDDMPAQREPDELISVAGDTADEQPGSVRAALANAMVGVKKELFGKGPERAKAYLNDDYVFVVLEGGLTRNEETLLEAGEEDLVRTDRLRFHEVVAPTATQAVEAITGRRVITYHSQIVFNPPRAFEIFLLEPAEG